jgi:hypothetical protein
MPNGTRKRASSDPTMALSELTTFIILTLLAARLFPSCLRLPPSPTELWEEWVMSNPEP